MTGLAGKVDGIKAEDIHNRLNRLKAKNLVSKDIADVLDIFSAEQLALGFDTNELALLDAALFSKYRDNKRQSFFCYHLFPLWLKAFEHLATLAPGARILELGCGTGQTSLMLSMAGFDVIGIDLSDELIALCNKRKHYYQSYCPELSAQFIAADAFRFDIDAIAPLDAIYSLFAFNLMKPAAELIERLSLSMRPGGIFMISDGNVGSVWNMLPSRRRHGVAEPDTMARLLKKNNFSIRQLVTHCMLPPTLFTNPFIERLGKLVESNVSGFDFYKHLCASYTVVAQKCD